MRIKPLLAALLVATTAQAAETDFRSLTPTERALIGREIRQVLLADPALTLPAFQPDSPAVPPAALGYRDEIDADRALLVELAPQLFAQPVAGPENAPRLTIITAPDCLDCVAKLDMLTDWATAGRIHLYQLPLNTPAAQKLGLDTAPSYVFETMIVRGDVPAVVLEKYLAKQIR